MAAEPNPDHLPPGWLARPEIQQGVLGEIAARGRRRRRRITLARLSVAAVIVVGGVFFLSPSTRRPETTATASQHRQILPDGSAVEQRETAAYSIDFDGVERRMTLTQGTVHIEVAKNADRPFVVIAAGVAVRAVGTAFSVELSGPSVEVLVTEGRVTVSENTRDAATRIAEIVDAGQGVVMEPGSANVVRAIPADQIPQKLAWRVRLLEFSGTPLAEAVNLLNQYNKTQFVIADPSLESVKLSGMIRADQVAGVVELLEGNGDITADQTTPGRIVLRRAQ